MLATSMISKALNISTRSVKLFSSLFLEYWTKYLFVTPDLFTWLLYVVSGVGNKVDVILCCLFGL